MRPQQRALLDAIIANPDDDVVRLVYADWLEENGDELRGEYIRAMVRDFPGSRTAYKFLDWRKLPFLGFDLPIECVVRMRRGFVEEIACSQADFVKHAGKMFLCHPVIRVIFAKCENRGDLYYRVYDRDGSGGPDGSLHRAIGEHLPIYLLPINRANTVFFDSTKHREGLILDAALAYGRAQAEILRASFS